MFYYGTMTGGARCPKSQVSSVVPAGGQLVFGVSAGNAVAGIAGTPGFQGYIFAVCEFQYATGYALITDGFGGVPSIASSYMAQIVADCPGSRKPA